MEGKNKQTESLPMSVIIFLIIASLFVATGFLIAFLWAVKTGQFDDHYTPSVRMLMDDQKPAGQKSEKKNKIENKKTGS